MSDFLKIPFWSVYFARYFFLPHLWKEKRLHLIASMIGLGALTLSAPILTLLTVVIILHLVIGTFIVVGPYTSDSAIS